MIKLTRLNNHLLVVNCDLIKLMENAPDTVLTLVTGTKSSCAKRRSRCLNSSLRFAARFGRPYPFANGSPHCISPALPAAVKDGESS